MDRWYPRPAMGTRTTGGERLRAYLRGPDARMWLWAAPLYAVLGFVLWYFLDVSLISPPYSNDSWTFVELSRNVFSDPGSIKTYRLFDSTEPYTTVLLGWPVVIHLVDMVTGADYRAPLQAAALCMIAAALFLDHAGKRWFGRRGFGPAVILLLMLFSFFHQGLLSADQITPAIMWLAVLIWVVSVPWPLSDRRVLATGLVSAAFVFTRVESAPIVMALVMVVWLVGGLRARQLWRYGAGLAIGLAPWMLYSVIHFRRPFVTPYSSSALLARVVTPVDYLPTSSPTLFGDPGLFFSRFGKGWPIMTNRFWLSVDTSLVVRPLVLVVVAVVVGAALVRAWRADDAGTPLRRLRAGFGVTLGRLWANRGVKVLVPTAVLSIGLNGLFELIGQAFDPRYWSLSFFLVEAALVAVLLAFDVRSVLVRGGAITLVAVLGLLPVAEQRAMTDLWPLNFYTGVGIQTDMVVDIAACVRPTERILFAEQSGMPYIYGALTDGTSVAEPLNFLSLTVEQRQQFLDAYDIEWISFGSPTPERMAEVRPRYEDLLDKDLAGTACLAGLYYIHDR